MTNDTVFTLNHLLLKLTSAKSHFTRKSYHIQVPMSLTLKQKSPYMYHNAVRLRSFGRLRANTDAHDGPEAQEEFVSCLKTTRRFFTSAKFLKVLGYINIFNTCHHLQAAPSRSFVDKIL